VPIWKYVLGKFVIPETGKKSGVEVSFGYNKNDAVLVDFDSGHASYERPSTTGGRSTLIRDQGPVEAVIYTHDGKLIAHDSAADNNNKTRTERLDAWRDRVKKVKEDGKKEGPGPKIGGS
jgi:hypothetical protein